MSRATNLVLCAVVAGIAGCASIASKSQYPVTINSNPSGAKVTVRNAKGVEVHKGTTPTTVTLAASAGYFKPASYSFLFEKEGHKPASASLSAGIDEHYSFNFLLGGAIGMFIVDPATGAMWKLDETVHGDLSPDINAVSSPATHQSVSVDPTRQERDKPPPSKIIKTEQSQSFPSGNEEFLPLGKSFAFIVGVGNYENPNLNKLPYAEDDARDFLDELKRLGWQESRIKSLTDRQATQANVRAALDGWLTKAGKNDLILLFWSGHGFPDPADPEKVYLACYDTDPDRPWTGYRMDRVVESLKEKGAKNVIVIADTCHAGKLVTRGERGLAVRPYIDSMRSQNQVPKGWIFMVAADSDRKAIEHSSWSNGAFTYCLLKGLRGEADGFEGVDEKDGIVTMRELRAYLSSRMPDETQRVLGIAKHPLITTSSGNPKIWELSLHGTGRGSVKSGMKKMEKGTDG